MITFKQFIKEDITTNPFAIAGKPAWTESLSTMLFDLPREGIKDVKIPISPAIFRRIWPKPVRTKVFHLTDFDGVKKVIKMQGGKDLFLHFLIWMILLSKLELNQKADLSLK